MLWWQDSGSFDEQGHGNQQKPKSQEKGTSLEVWWNCSFKVWTQIWLHFSTHLPVGPKDKWQDCHCESEREKSITKAIISSQRTKTRHPRELEMTKEILRELGNMIALHDLWTPGRMPTSSSTNHTLRTELIDTTPSRTQTGYEVVYTLLQIWMALRKVRKLNWHWNLFPSKAKQNLVWTQSPWKDQCHVKSRG